jgi:hypothetical protein
MLGFGEFDAFWYVVAAVGVGVLSAIAYGTRTFLRWLIGWAKREYLDWFAEAIDTHVEPKFAAIRQDTAARADEVKEDLRLHTLEEGEVVRGVVKAEVAPLRTMLDSGTAMFAHLEESLTRTESKLTEHMAHDDAVFDRVGEELKSGQDALLRALTRNQDRYLNDGKG